MTRETITRALKDLFQLHKEAFIVVDALDEAADPEEMLESLIILSQSPEAHVKVLVLSRPLDTFFALLPDGTVALEMNCENTKGDLHQYIENEVKKKLVDRRRDIDHAFFRRVVDHLRDSPNAM